MLRDTQNQTPYDITTLPNNGACQNIMKSTEEATKDWYIIDKSEELSFIFHTKYLVLWKNNLAWKNIRFL